MMRKAIPRPLARAVLVEAGHRCAIPTCHQTPVEIAHIVPWEEVKVHEFDNLIALCPNCHTRYDRHEIDRKAIQQYKANLSLLNSRYSDLELRLLRLFAKQPQANIVKLPGGNLVFVMYLIEDGYLVHRGSSEGHREDEFPNYDEYHLTERGREFVQMWFSGKKLE